MGDRTLKVAFWSMVGLLGWCYVGYPLWMEIRSRIPRYRKGKRRVDAEPNGTRQDTYAPRVSVVLAVRNEADRIGARLENLLTQDYPGDRLEIIVVANGCTDGTEEAVWDLITHEPRIRLLGSPPHDGKAGALNRGVASARGDVLVFADARQTFRSDVIMRLVYRLADPEVGAVSGRLVVERSGSPSLEGVRTYWAYETKIRLAESATGSVVGVTGAIYAVRRSIFPQVPPGIILDDLYVPLQVVRQGYRVILEPRAVAVDVPADGAESEFRRKVRTTVGNLQLIRVMPELLIPWRNPFFFRYFSHKVLRLMTPILLLSILVLGILVDGVVYRGFVAAQLAFYLFGIVGLFGPVRALSVPAAFVLVHAALVVALTRSHLSAEAVWGQGERPGV